MGAYRFHLNDRNSKTGFAEAHFMTVMGDELQRITLRSYDSHVYVIRNHDNGAEERLPFNKYSKREGYIYNADGGGWITLKSNERESRILTAYNLQVVRDEHYIDPRQAQTALERMQVAIQTYFMENMYYSDTECKEKFTSLDEIVIACLAEFKEAYPGLAEEHARLITDIRDCVYGNKAGAALRVNARLIALQRALDTKLDATEQIVEVKHAAPAVAIT